MFDSHTEYRLKAFISHMGTSTDVGHYVCHILRDGRWVIYNDEKVAESKTPPRDLAYVYLYERVEWLGIVWMDNDKSPAIIMCTMHYTLR